MLLIDDIDVCNDRDLLAAVLAHARAAQTTVIVSSEAAAWNSMIPGVSIARDREIALAPLHVLLQL
ncbi:hypothetical protein BQ8794_50141 [Mesorhizobium prunaredense]|uniref:Uncharacterized protein n=1 Tax=Mesorhizobium prunaredense TaxID=1631249 RepID=A0A1R3VDS6_9HYPH|nr:hypothetical protein BQ8794_50141 [Mesorhizobium prunaredense]